MTLRPVRVIVRDPTWRADRAARARRIRAQVVPKVIERDYYAAIVRLVIDPLRAALEPLFAALPDLIRAAAATRSELLHADAIDTTLAAYATRWASAETLRDVVLVPTLLTADAGEGRKVRRLLEQARAKVAETVTVKDMERLARKVHRATDRNQKRQLNNQIRAVFGADVFAVEPSLKPLTEAFVDANVGLIKDIGDKLATEIEITTTRAIQDGMLHGDLAKELSARFGFAEKRAALIARDQVGKAYGQINAARQRAIGVTKFRWRTVHDERVRSSHRARDGKLYSYAEPPDGELPGEPVLCRCSAEPDFAALLDD